MPHIELKTTANLSQTLDVASLLNRLADRLSAFETVKPAAVKAYHVPITGWVMGAGAPKGFVHCTVSVLDGRTVELRSQMADALVAVMREALAEEIRNGQVSVTLELREMESATYRK